MQFTDAASLSSRRNSVVLPPANVDEFTLSPLEKELFGVFVKLSPLMQKLKDSCRHAYINELGAALGPRLYDCVISPAVSPRAMEGKFWQ